MRKLARKGLIDSDKIAQHLSTEDERMGIMLEIIFEDMTEIFGKKETLWILLEAFVERYNSGSEIEFLSVAEMWDELKIAAADIINTKMHIQMYKAKTFGDALAFKLDKE